MGCYVPKILTFKTLHQIILKSKRIIIPGSYFSLFKSSSGTMFPIGNIESATF